MDLLLAMAVSRVAAASLLILSMAAVASSAPCRARVAVSLTFRTVSVISMMSLVCWAPPLRAERTSTWSPSRMALVPWSNEAVPRTYGPWPGGL